MTPDIISFGKKSQVCGILANREKLDRVEKHVFKESSRLNSTFGGNLVDMVRFKLILEIIEKDNLTANAQNMGDYLLKKLESLVSSHDDLSNARGRGLLVAFDFATETQRDLFVKNCLTNRLIIMGCGEKSIRFRPHLTVSEEDIDKTFEIIERSL